MKQFTDLVKKMLEEANKKHLMDFEFIVWVDADLDMSLKRKKSFLSPKNKQRRKTTQWNGNWFECPCIGRRTISVSLPQQTRISSNKERTIYGPRLVSKIDESNGLRLVYLFITILYHVMYLYLQKHKNPQWFQQSRAKGKCENIQTSLPWQVHFKGLFTCCERNLFEI